MEVHFTPEQEAQLSQLARHAGTDTEHLVKDAALHLLEEDRRLREGVERGITAAERGEFVESDQVWANVEKILHS
jgi:predicted transcriptional regulator